MAVRSGRKLETPVVEAAARTAGRRARPPSAGPRQPRGCHPGGAPSGHRSPVGSRPTGPACSRSSEHPRCGRRDRCGRARPPELEAGRGAAVPPNVGSAFEPQAGPRPRSPWPPAARGTSRLGSWPRAARLAAATVDPAAGQRSMSSVACGPPLDETVLRSYCIGAAHMGWSWLTSEALTVDPERARSSTSRSAASGWFEPSTHPGSTFRSSALIGAMPGPPTVSSRAPLPEQPVNGSDAVFAAVAAAGWLSLGCRQDWPVSAEPEESLVSKPVGPYTPIVEAGPWLICSGQVGIADGALVERRARTRAPSGLGATWRSCSPAPARP